MSLGDTFSMGVEEEYFVFHAETRRSIIRGDKTFIANATRRLGKHLMTEMLQSQIEVATPPCGTAQQVRQHLTEYRQTLGEEARARGLGIAGTGTFPLAFWRQQEQTEKERYDAIMDDLQMVGMRNMLCGMHVHVEVPDGQSRVALMRRLVPYLPLLLALSVSSPFWQGYRTGLHGYRLAAYDELPRTGLPEPLRTEQEYDEYIQALVSAGIMPDASHIWWAIRPSLKHPTIELRIADSCTRVDDAVAIAALFRCLVRALVAETSEDAYPDRISRAITAENKWRAQRYGMEASFVHPFRRESVPAAAWLDETIARVQNDVGCFACDSEVEHLRRIAREGTSAKAQLAVYRAERQAGRTRPEALRAVVDWAGETTVA